MPLSNVKDYAGIITLRNGLAFGDPLLIRYDAQAVNTLDVVKLTNHLPVRRISQGAKITAAEPLDPCRIVVVNGVTFLHAFTEGIKFKEACP